MRNNEQIQEHELKYAFGRFADKMEQRLIDKEKEGFFGWEDESKINNLELLGCILKAVGEKKFADAANFCMMLEYRQESNADGVERETEKGRFASK